MDGMRLAEKTHGPANFDLKSETQEQNFGSQQLFSMWLERVRKNEVFQLPDFSAKVDQEGKITQGLDRSLGIGLHIADSLSDIWEGERNAPDRFSFIPQSLLRVGREDSRRQVFFGSLDMTWFNGHQESLQVAVKPFEGLGSRRRAMHELAMYQLYAGAGIPSINVLGSLVVPSKKDRESVYQISLFEPGLTTMDNINWNELAMEARWAKVGAVAVRTFVLMNGKHLLFHGDASFRNMAFRDVKDEVAVIDPEFSVNCIKLGHPSGGSNELAKRMSADFTELTHSVDDKVLRGMGLTDIEKFEEHTRHIYLPYREQLLREDVPYRGLLARVLDRVVEQKAEQAEGTWTGTSRYF